MQKSRFLEIYLVLCVLISCFSIAYGNETVSFFNPDPDSSDSQQSKSGTEITTIFVEGPDGVREAVELTAEMVERVRADNPDAHFLEILEIKSKRPRVLASTITASEVVAALKDEIPRSMSFGVEPAEDLQARIETVEEGFFQRYAEGEITRTKLSLSIIRGVTAGTFGAIAVICSDLPWPAVVAGGVTAGYISGNFQYINDYFKNWIDGKAFWDRGDHRDSPLWRWRIAYGSWKGVKLFTHFFGYLVSMQLVLGISGGAYDLSLSSLPWEWSESFHWLKETGFVALLTTLSEGMWDIYDASRRRSLFKDNWFENRNNIELGKKRAIGIVKGSQILAIALAASTVVPQMLHAAIKDTYWSPRMLIALGAAAGVTYVWKCTKPGQFAAQFVKKALGCTRSFFGLGK